MILGFERSRLAFTLRTAFASGLALVVATLLHLDSPQWAAMTVWLVTQPTRGLLIEKSFYRALGSLIGSVVAVGLVLATGGQLPLLIPGLVLWVGLCAGLGNLLRHFRAYGIVLAGYTAALVVLIDVPHPDHIVTIASQRVFAVLVGIVVSAVVSGILIPDSDDSELRVRLRQLASETLRWSAQHVRLALIGDLHAISEAAHTERQRQVLSDLAALEDSLDAQMSGKIEGRSVVRSARSVIAALLSLMAAAHSAAGRVQRGVSYDRAVMEALMTDLEVIAQDLDHALVGQSVVRLRSTAAASGGAVHVALETLLQAVEALVSSRADGRAEGNPSFTLLFHRDWVGARAAAIRSMVAMGAVGVLWWLTKWPFAPFMMVGTAVMSSLFSTFDDPLRVLRFVLLGSISGATAATVCHLWLLPFAHSNLEAALYVLPFLAVAGVAMAHPKTTLSSLDYAMALLLLVVPKVPVVGTPVEIVSGALAAVAGIAAAMVAFRFVLPVNGRQRLHTLMSMTVHELEDLARGESAPHPTRWRARLFHRILRLVRRLDLTHGTAHPLTAIGGGVATLSVGEAIVRVRQLAVRSDLPRSVRRRVEVGVGRLARLSSKPEAAAGALDRVAQALVVAEGVPTLDVEVLKDGAEALRQHGAFFRLAAGGRGA